MQYRPTGFRHGPRDKRPTARPGPPCPYKLRSIAHEKFLATPPCRTVHSLGEKPSGLPLGREKRPFDPNSAECEKNRSYVSPPTERIPIPPKRTNGIPTCRPTAPGQFETRPAKSAPVTVFALFGNMLSKNPATLLIKHTSYEPKRLRSDAFEKIGHNLLIRRITKKSVYCRAKEDLRIIKHCFYEI